MAARQRARLPPTRKLNRGARGPCHRGNNSAGGGEEGRERARGRDRGCGTPLHPLQPKDGGSVQSGWPEFTVAQVGFDSFNGGHIKRKVAINQRGSHRMEIRFKEESASGLPLSSVHLLRHVICYQVP